MNNHDPLFIAALQLLHSIENAEGYDEDLSFEETEVLDKPFNDFWEGLPESLFEEWLEWQSSIICTDLYYHSVV